MKKQQLLKQDIIKEILACGNDPIYFIEKYCKVRHARRGLVDFILYDYQKEAIRTMVSTDRLIVNKARQLGFTTLTAAFIAWLILFHKDKEVLVVSINAEVAKGMIEKVKVILTNLPDWMYLADFKMNRAHKVALSNGSSVESVARSDDAGRSKALALLIIDEAALIRNMDEMWKGLKSTVSTGGKIFAMSTPRGMGNWFHKTWMEAKSGENGWSTLHVDWWECPEYSYDLVDDPSVPGGRSSSWFRDFTKDMTKMQISQELLTTFLETSDTYFDSETIKFWTQNIREPIAKTFNDRGLWIWQDPNPNHKYLISADSATGAGEDFSAFHVIDLHTMNVSAEYKGKIYPDIFADLLVETAESYNKAWIAPENAHVGAVTCFQIKNKGYNNLVYLNKEFKLVDKWVAEYQGILPGIPNDVRNRGAMVARLEEALRKKEITVFSGRLVNEMNTFTIINNKPQAMKTADAHDDIIMALAIGVWIREIIPEFNINYNPVEAGKILSSIVISKQQFNHKEMTIAQRQTELKKTLEQKGYSSINPAVFNPYIYFSR